MTSSADLIFVNGGVLTMDPQNPVVEGVAVRGRRIADLGSSSDMEDRKGPQTQVIDLGGRTLMPGFIDAHCHAGIYGTVKKQVTCGGPDVRSIDDILARLRERAETTPPDQWILSRGYKEFELEETRPPTRWDLDRAAPNHKVFMLRTCGHIAAVNSNALKALGVGRTTPDPDGGRYERDAAGEPTGVLLETAAIAARMMARPTEAAFQDGLGMLNRDFHRLGITEVHDASGLYPEEIRQFQAAIQDETLQMRVSLMFRFSGSHNRMGEHLLQTGLMTGFGNDQLKIGPYKLMLDGAGSSGTAYMSQPPPGRPGECGLLYFAPDELDAHILKAHAAGYQIAIHAIGDKALDLAVAGIEKALKKTPRPDHRHRIEHFGFPSPAVMAKVRDLGIIPVLGLPFLYELGDQYLDIYGPEMVAGAYPLKRLHDAGVPAAMSSDAPVIDPNPFHGIHFALNRTTLSGRTIAPEQRCTLTQVLRAYTAFGAFACFAENDRGVIQRGKRADLVALSEDIRNVPRQEILRIKPEMTVFDGRIVFGQDG